MDIDGVREHNESDHNRIRIENELRNEHTIGKKGLQAEALLSPAALYGKNTPHFT